VLADSLSRAQTFRSHTLKSPRELNLLARTRVVAAITASLLLLAPVRAQQGEGAIKLQTDLVAIDVTVTDKDGNFVRKLSAEDFVVYEDSEPRKVEFFEASEETALTRSQRSERRPRVLQSLSDPSRSSRLLVSTTTSECFKTLPAT